MKILSVILVPLLILKFLTGARSKWCRNFKIAALGFGLWLAGGNTASADTNYPWCIITGGLSEGAYSCGYVSFEQCQQTRLGTDMCVVNPLYKPSSPSSSASRPAPPPRERVRR